MILYHTIEFEIYSHNMNVFIIRNAHYVKKNARKVVTLIRKTISLDLNLDKYFDQMDSVRSELISLIGLTTENNFPSRNAL